ncbi:MAG TPA: NOL1/NOP2/sun family putative RNA methylase [Candidatus Nanoarchaeia archaeon]|nr:NOL1/NOP2/sun family putative RNA methylase [Candidatus Nanoarchaeia archaeon]
MENIVFKDKFIERYSNLTDIEEFKKYSTTFLRRSLRVNTLKITVKELKDRLKDWKLTQVPWCKEGFFITGERRDIGNLIEHALGYVYIQEAASMIPSIVLNPSKEDLVLDMAAAPGSKTTHLASIMDNNGLIIANDYDYKRIKALGINLQRCGVLNTIITLQQGRFFKDFNFDKILLDAPCSGTGAIRKSLKTLLSWNANMVRRLAGTQRQLIKIAFENLKEKGTLVYSTCSVEPEENEAIVSYLLDTFDNAKIEKINLDLKRTSPILEFDNQKYREEVKDCLRIWPQDNDTEGFFITKIKKV